MVTSRNLAKVLIAVCYAGGIALANPASAATVSTPAAAQKLQTKSGPLVDRWASLIKDAAKRFGVSEDWIRAVMCMESGGRTEIAGTPITSKADAMGVMQIMPQTYAELRQQYGLGPDPYDPHDNVFAGAAYLRWLHGKFGFPAMFAAYNAGPGTLDDTPNAQNLPAETRAYVSGIDHILGLTPDQTYADEALTLTRPDGSPVSISGNAVESIRAPLPDEYAPSVQTVVAMGAMRQGVREDLATVASLLKKHGSKAKILNG